MLKSKPTSFEELLEAMKTTEQMPGLSVHEHGLMVVDSYRKLIQDLDNGIGDETLLAVYEKVKSLLLETEIIETYQEFHDCGKPFCLVFDEEGKKHFPDHANVSADVWEKLFPDQVVIQRLIRKDMDFHTFKAEAIDNLWEDDLSSVLYLTAWAEIRANATMFGGEDSVSFKIKKKHLIKAGKRLLKKI